MTTTATTRPAPQPGDTFRAVIADANVLFEVTRATRTNIVAIGVDEPVEIGGRTFASDYAGLVKHFTPDEVVRAIARDAFFAEHRAADAARREDFWSALPEGSLVHLSTSDGHGFVRCEVVRTPEGKVAKPVALVGYWNPRDLPRRSATGEPVRDSRFVAAIRAGEPLPSRPEFFYEHPEFAPRARDASRVDPRTLSAIDLTLPEPTEAEQIVYARERLAAEVIALLSMTGEPVQDRLDRARALLA